MLEDSESSESDDDFNCNDEWWMMNDEFNWIAHVAI
jgi:hypothetical protein